MVRASGPRERRDIHILPDPDRNVLCYGSRRLPNGAITRQGHTGARANLRGPQTKILNSNNLNNPSKRATWTYRR